MVYLLSAIIVKPGIIIRCHRIVAGSNPASRSEQYKSRRSVMELGFLIGIVIIVFVIFIVSLGNKRVGRRFK